MSVALLLSGGMDSVALAFWRRPNHAITINYGQRAFAGEWRAAKQVASELNIAHHLIEVDCQILGLGQMVGTEHPNEAPSPEWWPYRNQLLITLAAMKCAQLGVRELMIGTVKEDDLYADGTPAFLEQVDALVRMQEGGLRITAPAIALSTEELTRTCGIPYELLAWAHSCNAAPYACGTCRSCEKHADVMDVLGYTAY